MTARLRRCAVILCTSFLTFSAAMVVYGQNSPNTRALREQLRLRYEIVALRDGLGLVPLHRTGDIRLIEIRNGGVSINGEMVSARELRQQLGRDADLILRLTYLDAAAQRELARRKSTAATAQGTTRENANAPEPVSPVRTQVHRGDLVRIGGNVSVGRDEIVKGDVVAIGGSANIDGQVTRDATVIGGSLNLGPEAVVGRNVAVIGGSLNRSPGARINGKIDTVGVGPHSSWHRVAIGNIPFWLPVSRVGGLVGTLLRIMLLILGALVVVALGGRFVEAIADRAASEPLRSGLTGLLMEILFVPLLILTIVVLAVSIIGIPLLFLVPFAIVLAVVLMLVGFTGIACQVGRFLSNRFGIKKGPYASVALGVVAVVAVTLLAKIIALAGSFAFGLVVAGSLSAVGYLAEYVAWTMGIGALMLTWLSARRRVAPTPSGAGPVAGGAHAE